MTVSRKRVTADRARHLWQQPRSCQGWSGTRALQTGLELLVDSSARANYGMDVRNRRGIKCKAARTDKILQVRYESAGDKACGWCREIGARLGLIELPKHLQDQAANRPGGGGICACCRSCELIRKLAHPTIRRDSKPSLDC